MARNRVAFDKKLINLPLMRRQLMKLMVPTEQALSIFIHTADVMEDANSGDQRAARELRILTGLLKFRACRDNIQVATGAMEARGGNGYIEDWVNAKLVRDAHVGLLWEGTSNINALDVVTRAVRKDGAHETLAEAMHGLLGEAVGLPEVFRERLAGRMDQAAAIALRIAETPEQEPLCRTAATGLYNAASAALLAWEGARIGAEAGDARRMLLARLVLEHRLSPGDPLNPAVKAWEAPAIELLLSGAPVALTEAARLVALA